MTCQKRAFIYLHWAEYQRAIKGTHNFLQILQQALGELGYDVVFEKLSDATALKARLKNEHSIFWMEHPDHPNGLVIRPTYVGPFWHLEQSGQRWQWPVSQDHFDPTQIDPAQAKTFTHFWRRKLFGPTPFKGCGKDHIFVPLQGVLCDHRSFQIASPIAMLLDVITAFPSHRVVARLHPKECYSDREMAALETLEQQYANFEISSQDATQLLRRAAAVVTQNSSLGFLGLFLNKPLALFAKTDFHHIALKPGTSHAGLDGLLDHQPDFARYLFWFLQHHAINAGRPDAVDNTKSALLRCGW